MKKNIAKHTCYMALATGLLATVVLGSVACSGPEMPKMTVSYGPEIGFADGNVNLSGSTPNINISDIRAEVGMNIDYLSGVIVQNEDEFEDLEIRVDASMVDIFTPGNYKVVYTFLFGDNTVSKEITVTLFENEQSASDSDSVPDNNVTTKKPTSGNTSSDKEASDKETSTTIAGNNEKPTPTKDNTSSSSKPTSGNDVGTTKPTTSADKTDTTKPTVNDSTTTPTTSTRPPVNDNTTNPIATSDSTTTTKPIPPTSNSNISTPTPSETTSNNSGSESSDSTTTTREIITTTGDKTTESKNIGNYTIELLSGKTITIKNTTSRYIVSTRTDVEMVEENGYTYKISKLIITYNTGFGQILETIKDRVK